MCVIDLRLRDADPRLGLEDIGTRGDRRRILRGRRRDAFADQLLERLTQRQSRVRRHAEQPFQLHQPRAPPCPSVVVDPPRASALRLGACRDRAAASRPVRPGTRPAPRCRVVAASNSSVTDNRPDGGQDLAIFRPHVRGQGPLLVSRSLMRGIDLAVGNGDAGGLAVEIQRPLQFDTRLSIGATWLLLLRKRDATDSAGAPPAYADPAPHRFVFARPEVTARVRVLARSRSPTSVHLRGQDRVRLPSFDRQAPAPPRLCWP